MTDYNALLLPIFYEMRQMGVPLGIPEYLLAIKTIREGMHIGSADALKRLCRLLWAKSRQDQDIFNTAFERFAEPYLQLLPEQIEGSSEEAHISPISPSVASPPSSSKADRETKRRPQPASEEREVSVPFRSVSVNLPPEKPYMTYRSKQYHLTPRLPIDIRDMAGLWRHLRRLQREGPREELDVQGTIDKICRVGFFTSPVLQARRRNQAKLVLLIDQQGSMAPFSLIIEALVESALRGGLLGKCSVYYFHDCPEELVFGKSNLSDPSRLGEVLAEHATNSCVLIVSDAGAARGRYHSVRVASTKEFLKTLRKKTYLYAWLNPMPANMWVTTTAGDIADAVPMFHLDREGLNDAIDILRGHPFPPGVNADA